MSPATPCTDDVQQHITRRIASRTCLRLSAECPLNHPMEMYLLPASDPPSTDRMRELIVLSHLLRCLLRQHHCPAKCGYCIPLPVTADHGFDGQQRQVTSNHRCQVSPFLNARWAFDLCVLRRVLVAVTIVAHW